jgi:hypothetical protein
VPNRPEIRELRDFTRYRKTQVEARAKEIQRMDKTLHDAGIKLSSVASKVWSQSSQAMIDGERDPSVLAQMAKSRLRAKIPQLGEAFSGGGTKLGRAMPWTATSASHSGWPPRGELMAVRGASRARPRGDSVAASGELRMAAVTSWVTWNVEATPRQQPTAS